MHVSYKRNVFRSTESAIVHQRWIFRKGKKIIEEWQTAKFSRSLFFKIWIQFSFRGWGDNAIISL